MSEVLFLKFNSQDAYDLGIQMYEACQQQNVDLGIEIYLYGRTVFQFIPDSLGPDKADWLRRKRNTVLYFGMSTFAMNEKCKSEESLLATKYARKLEDYTLTPGSVPIILKDSGIVGCATVTGLAPQEDHDFVSAQLSEYFQRVEQ
ncbi:MAG: hypothetical protein GX328_06205 [Clostridiaceae bacterium]|nr:hypothetical protein [Clostridiaceae bacterium]